MTDLFNPPTKPVAKAVLAREPDYDGPLCPKSDRRLKCRCGDWATFGDGVHLKQGRTGNWYCFTCAPANLRRGQP